MFAVQVLPQLYRQRKQEEQEVLLIPGIMDWVPWHRYRCYQALQRPIRLQQQTNAGALQQIRLWYLWELHRLLMPEQIRQFVRVEMLFCPQQEV
ncbi:hypothetical protein D3C86_1658280 [compost metagenome]